AACGHSNLYRRCAVRQRDRLVQFRLSHRPHPRRVLLHPHSLCLCPGCLRRGSEAPCPLLPHEHLCAPRMV
ncbi:hypothetical protein GGI11_006039, partial [Coemansia sp. RSA 2049]